MHVIMSLKESESVGQKPRTQTIKLCHGRQGKMLQIYVGKYL